MILKIKRGFIQDSTFIDSDPGYAKSDKPRENEARTRREEKEPEQKMVKSHTLDMNFMA